MSKSKKGPDLAKLKIFLIVGAIGSGLAAIIFGLLLYGIQADNKKVKEPDPDPVNDTDKENTTLHVDKK